MCATSKSRAALPPVLHQSLMEMVLQARERQTHGFALLPQSSEGSQVEMQSAL